MTKPSSARMVGMVLAVRQWKTELTLSVLEVPMRSELIFGSIAHVPNRFLPNQTSGESNTGDARTRNSHRRYNECCPRSFRSLQPTCEFAEGWRASCSGGSQQARFDDYAFNGTVDSCPVCSFERVIGGRTSARSVITNVPESTALSSWWIGSYAGRVDTFRPNRGEE